MTVVDIAQLKARLSEHIARVRGGEEVLVTERGRPVARIVPAAASARLGELERSRVLRVGGMTLPDGFLDTPRPRSTGSSVSEALLEERRSGR